MTAGQKAIQRALKKVLSVWGECFLFRNKEVVGVVDSSVTQKDHLKYDTAPTDLTKIEIPAGSIEGGKPRKGEYLLKGSTRYRIVDVQYMGAPKDVYLIECQSTDTVE